MILKHKVKYRLNLLLPNYKRVPGNDQCGRLSSAVCFSCRRLRPVWADTLPGKLRPALHTECRLHRNPHHPYQGLVLAGLWMSKKLLVEVLFEKDFCK